MMDTLDTPVRLGAFAASHTDLAALQRGPVLARLDDLGCIRAEGPDALAFLQSQLTNDVAHLVPTALQLNAYCTPKGRLLATFHQWRDGEAVLLQLPREILVPVMKRLSMFVLRSKAKLVDVSSQHAAYGLIGPRAVDALRAAGLDVPDAPWTSTIHNGLRASRMPAGGTTDARFLLDVPAGAALPPGLAALPSVAAAAWWWSEIAAAVPTVFATTQESFVPQMINFEVLGGVNFKKGCYPGQEIVARSQYLGKLKRRMQIGHADTTEPPAAGADVFHSGQPEPVGTVVMSALAPPGGVDLLFELPVDRLDSGTLHLDARDGIRIDVRALPYALFDPTA
jgi:folate-binding protein YgfZ